MKTAVRVGLFLALRQIKRSSASTSVLIIFIMTLTFLNLVVVTGILDGLVIGSSRAYENDYSSDIIISNPPNTSYIKDTRSIVTALENTGSVRAISPRFLAAGRVQANYNRVIRAPELPDEVGAQLIGIDPKNEDAVTQLSRLVIEGRYLDENDRGSILIGSGLLEQYSLGAVPGTETLEQVDIGTKVKIIVQGKEAEFTVKGIVKSKITNISRRVFFNDSELRSLIDRTDNNVAEIAVKLMPGVSAYAVTDQLAAQGFGKNALIQTATESQGQFFQDIGGTFTILGAMFSSIGLIVASITIFIIVFINASSRKKQIGILKGIGISAPPIEFAYVLQALIYSATGIIIGVLLTYLVLVPYFAANPIDFPFSDGILVAPVHATLLKSSLIMITSILAGFIPIRIVMRGKTLDAILGR